MIKLYSKINCGIGPTINSVVLHVIFVLILELWYGVNSYSSQFVLKSTRTHFGQFVLNFRSIRTHRVKFSQLVLILVNSYSVWSIRTHAKKYNFDDIYHIIDR